MFTLLRAEGIHFQTGPDAGETAATPLQPRKHSYKTGPEAGEVTQQLQSTVKVPLSKAPYL